MPADPESLEERVKDKSSVPPASPAFPAQLEQTADSSTNPTPQNAPSIAASIPSNIPSHGLEPTQDQSLPPRTSPSQSFWESKICVAVDVSASTYGDVLEAEKKSVRNICKLIPKKLRPTISILPWNNAPGAPITLDEIDSLDSRGGTNPNVFLQNTPCRDILQGADFWLLMTDGEIEDTLVRRFARGLVEYGLHGKACIISVFGEPDSSPADCNITVGLSVFAVSPHAAFLYYDVGSGKTYILQTKGCFSALLPPGQHNPVLTVHTTWDDLPLTAFEDLSRVSVPQSQVVGSDEIILQGNKRVNLSQFLKELPEDDQTISEVLDNKDNMKTIALTAKLRGESDRLRAWLDRVDLKLEKEGQAELAREKAPSQLVVEAMENLWQPERISEPQMPPIPPVPTAVRYPPPPPPSIYDLGINVGIPPSYNVPFPVSRLTQTHHRQSSSGHMRAISDSSLTTAGQNLSGEYLLPGDRAPYTLDTYWRPPEQRPQSLRIPGFSKSRRKDSQFSSGKCTICQSASSVVTFLLRDPPDQSITPDFPFIWSHSILVFPLTMGNYAETDIVASVLACEKCALASINQAPSPHGQRLVALPLVPFSENREAWLETVDSATGRRFHKQDLPLVFLAIMYTKYEKLFEQDHEHFSALLDAIKWECNMILSEFVIQPGLNIQSKQFGPGALHEVLLRNFNRTLDDQHAMTLLEYPLDGFIIANVALSNSKHSRKISGEKRKTIVFLRFLYHLTKNYFDFVAQNDGLLLQAAKSLVLLVDEPSGRSALFRWDSIRQLSMRFKDPVEMRRYISRTNPYRVSTSPKDLSGSPLLSQSDITQFERLGILFSWISSQATHATAVFLHHLFRAEVEGATTQERFAKLRAIDAIERMLKDPTDISPKKAEAMIRSLPSL